MTALQIILINLLADEMRIKYLTSIFTPFSIACADHAFGDVEVTVLQPHVAQLTIQYRNLDFIHCRLVLGRCEITTYQNTFVYISPLYVG
jgi:hypothetical protein